MRRAANPGGVPDWKLERYLLDELPPPQAREVAARVEADPQVRARLETLRVSSTEVLERYPAPWMGRRIQRRLEGQDRAAAGWRRWLAPRLTAPAAAIALTVAVLVSLPVEEAQRRPAPAPGLRTKGLRPHLVLHRKTASGSERLADGATARAGDRILVQYQAVGAAYGAILSVDGRGVVTRHFPERGSTAAPLQADGPVPLDFSYELDDAPEVERFFLITGNEPFAVDDILAAARTAAGDSTAPAELPLPAALSQSTFTLCKSPPPAEAAP